MLSSWRILVLGERKTEQGRMSHSTGEKRWINENTDKLLQDKKQKNEWNNKLNRVEKGNLTKE